MSKSKYTTIDEVIIEANKIHNNKYIYENTNETKIHMVKTILHIICPEHGKFTQTLRHHLYRKQGCPKCGNILTKTKETKTTEEFVLEAKKLHGKMYIYDKSVYINCKLPIIITCKIHGDFLITPDKHLCGNGCKKCRYIKMSNTRISSLEELITASKKTHGERYSYINSLKGIKTLKIEILCKSHGPFFQTWAAHIKGAGCSKCANTFSYGELLIKNWLDTQKIKYVREKKFDTLLNPITNKHLRFDFYLSDLQIAIEFQGAHHYKDGVYPNKSILSKVKYSDELKVSWCKMTNIKLLLISMYDTTRISEILENAILPK